MARLLPRLIPQMGLFKKEYANKLLVNIGIFNDDLPGRGNKGKKKKEICFHERIKKVLLPDRFVGVTSFSNPRQIFSSRMGYKNL